MSNCDVCDEEAFFATGTYYTVNEFVDLIRNGFELPERNVRTAAAMGISKEMLLASLPPAITSTSATGWLLCPGCANRASKFLPRPVGNLPDGEKGQGVDHAGVGKMTPLISSMGVKVMMGQSLPTASAPKVYKCDFCSRVMPHESVRFIPATRIHAAVGSGFHPFGKPGIVIGTVPPPANIEAWRSKALQDQTNWGLCPDCEGAFSNVSVSTASGKAEQSQKKSWQFWK
jgi:hypothetical protein